MADPTGDPTIRVSPPHHRRIPVSAECTSAERYGATDGHRTCRGNGPVHLPGIPAPVLPAIPCGCTCHLGA
jgi:hypothetical protein